MATSVSASTSARCSKPSARPSTRGASASPRSGVRLTTTTLPAPAAAQGDGDALAHDAGSDDCDATTVETVEPFDRHLDRRVTDRRGAAPDAGLGASPLADHQRLAEQQVHGGARAALAAGPSPTPDGPGRGSRTRRRTAESSPAATSKRWLHGGVVVVGVEVRMQVVGGDVAELAQEVADVGVGAVELLGDGVDLGAVAGADQHHLAHVVADAPGARPPSATRRRRP